MKKLFTLFVSSALCMAASAQTITFTAEVDGETRNIELNTIKAGTKTTVDWGDGNVVEGCDGVAYDGWETAKISGTVKGNGVVKIYGDSIVNFSCVSNVNGASLTAIDLSNAKDLQYLEINGNVRLTSLDVTACPELVKLYIGSDPIEALDLTKSTKLTTLEASCTAAAPGALTSLDLSKNTLLSTLKLNFQKLTALDLTSNVNLGSLYATDNAIESLTLPETAAKLTYLSLNNNKLTTFDGAKLTGMSKTKGSLFFINNSLTSLTNAVTKTANISNNKFTISTMPDATNIGTLTYTPQKEMAVAENISETIDLSSELDGGNTTYAVLAEDGTAVDAANYSVENGVVTFKSALNGKKVRVAMTSAKWANFKTTNALKTTLFTITFANSIATTLAEENAPSEMYNLAGQRINSKSGIVIMNGKKYLAK